MRYLIQLKARATELVYNDSNILLCHITQPHNFLGFEFIEYGVEREHLRLPETNTELSEIDSKIIELKQTEPHLCLREMAERLETNKMKVKRVLDRNGYTT